MHRHESHRVHGAIPRPASHSGVSTSRSSGFAAFAPSDPRLLTCALLLVLGLRALPLGAQEEPPGEPTPTSPGVQDTPGEDEGDADEAPGANTLPAVDPTASTRLLGPPLIPFYHHYERLSDRTRVLNLFYLYRSTSRPNGDASSLLVPFYYWQRQLSPLDNRLHLFPLLYFSRETDTSSYDLSPIYGHVRTPETDYRYLFPAWYSSADRETGASTHHILFPLGTARFRGDEGESSGFRFGLYKTLELAEAYRSDDETRVNVFSLFSLGDEASSSVALFRHRESEDTSRTHLFPLYWSGETENSDYTVVAPLYLSSSSPQRTYQWLFPFYGLHVGGIHRDLFLPFVFFRYGSSEGGGRRWDALFPILHRSYGPGFSDFRLTPFFGYSWTPQRREWGLVNLLPLNWLYANEYYPESGKTAHSFLWPLGRHDVEPDEVDGHIRFLPLYYDTFDSDSRLRLSPLFLSYQRRSGTKVDRFVNVALPTYLGFGAPDDYFGTGFPLYWESRTGPSGWNLFVPFWLSFYSRASFGLHLFPLFSYNNYPSERFLSLVGPTFIHRRFYGFEQAPEGSSTSVLWPFFQFENRRHGYHYRALPLGWVSRDREQRDFLLFPLWYRQWGGGTSQDYFFPLYGRFDSERITRDFYALGSYAYTRERDEEGEVFRRRHDALWWLFSSQSNERRGSHHRHFLPLGYWETRSPAVDREIWGPFYYGHRSDSDDVRHRLDLVLGNFWFAEDIEEPETPLAISPAREAPTEEERRSLNWKVTSRERGVLWPLVRWGSDDQGNRSQWALPSYFYSETSDGTTLGLFPLAFFDTMKDRYRPSYFRYFYLFDRETFGTGHRFTVGQVLFDWFQDDKSDVRRWRALYPLIEHRWDPAGYRYQFTPILRGSVQEEGGRRVSSHFLFPIFWKGSTQKRGGAGEYETETEHFYLFPLFGVSHKSLRSTYDVLLPFFHIVEGLNTFKFQLRPLLFYRDDPEELSLRFWPFHAFENGESAGEWWVSKYLFLSRVSVSRDRWAARLDPFLFRASSAPDSAGFAALFEAWAYDRDGAETSFRALPFSYGYSEQDEAGLDVLPLYHSRNYGDRPIDYFDPLRPFFLVSHLRGNQDRYTSILTLLLEYESNDRRPYYSDFRFLFRMFQDTRTESSYTFAINPLFYYSRDDAELSKIVYFFLPLYRYEEQAGQGTHYIFWFLPIARS